MEEYCMYFPFSELRKWSKKTAETRRRNCAVLPSVFRKPRILQMQQNPLFDQFVLQAGHIQRRDVIRHGHCQTRSLPRVRAVCRHLARARAPRERPESLARALSGRSWRHARGRG